MKPIPKLNAQNRTMQFTENDEKDQQHEDGEKDQDIDRMRASSSLPGKREYKVKTIEEMGVLGLEDILEDLPHRTTGAICLSRVGKCRVVSSNFFINYILSANGSQSNLRELEKINRKYQNTLEKGFVKSVLPLRHFIFEDLDKHAAIWKNTQKNTMNNQYDVDYAQVSSPTETNELKEKISMNAQWLLASRKEEELKKSKEFKSNIGGDLSNNQTTANKGGIKYAQYLKTLSAGKRIFVKLSPQQLQILHYKADSKKDTSRIGQPDRFEMQVESEETVKAKIILHKYMFKRNFLRELQQKNKETDMETQPDDTNHSYMSQKLQVIPLNNKSISQQESTLNQIKQLNQASLISSSIPQQMLQKLHIFNASSNSQRLSNTRNHTQQSAGKKQAFSNRVKEVFSERRQSVPFPSYEYLYDESNLTVNTTTIATTRTQNTHSQQSRNRFNREHKINRRYDHHNTVNSSFSKKYVASQINPYLRNHYLSKSYGGTPPNELKDSITKHQTLETITYLSGAKISPRSLSLAPPNQMRISRNTSPFVIQEDNSKYNPPLSAVKRPFTSIDPRRRLNSAKTSSRGNEINVNLFM